MIEAYLGGEVRESRAVSMGARDRCLSSSSSKSPTAASARSRASTSQSSEGELVCLIGANGAGKTTTLKGICGPAAASRRARSATPARTSPARRAFQLARRGLAMVPEGRGVFAQLTVEENLRWAPSHPARPGGDPRGPRAHVRALPAPEGAAPADRRHALGGEQQMLAIGRALMARPKLLLLDEPSMGLAPIMVQKIFEIVRKMSGEGVTILLVEQNARLALEVSQRGYVMESGEITLAGDAKALLHDPAAVRWPDLQRIQWP